MRGATPRLTLASVAALTVLCAAPEKLRPASGEMSVQVYSTDDGLGHPRVKHIVADSHGFLWFSTADGLTRFDGRQFVNFGASEGVPFGSANHLLEIPGQDGCYWIASNDHGIVRFMANRTVHGLSKPVGAAFSPALFTAFTVSADAAANRVNILLRDRRGDLWIGTDGGLFLRRDNGQSAEIRPVAMSIPGHPERQVQVTSLAEDEAGRIYVGTRHGLVRFPAGQGSPTYFPIGDSPATEGVLSSLYKDGVLWIGHRLGLICWRPSPEAGPSGLHEEMTLRRAVQAGSQRITKPPSIAGTALYFRPPGSTLPASTVTAVSALSNGRIWFSSRDAMFEFTTEGGVRTIDVARSSLQVLTIAEDPGGSVWLGTSGGGAIRLTPRHYTIYGPKDGIGLAPLGVLVDNSGDVIVPARPRQLAVSQGGSFAGVQLRLPPDAVISNYRSVLKDRSGEWWIATSAGLYRFPKRERATELAGVAPKAVYKKVDGLADDAAHILFEDRQGDIWVSGFGPSPVTLTRWERSSGKFFRYSVADGLPAFNEIGGIASDHKGRLWFFFRDGGFARYSQGRFECFHETQGLPLEPVKDFAMSQDGNLWYATARSLVRVDPDSPAGQLRTVTILSTRKSLSTSAFFSVIAMDAAGRICAGSARGVDRVDPATGGVVHYEVGEGIPAEDIIGIAVDRAGALWVCNMGRVVRFAPGSATTERPAPVLIAGVRVNGIPFQVPAVGATHVTLGNLPADMSSFEIGFLRQSFGLGQSPLFQYKLEGTAAGWSGASPLGAVNYATLAPGQYRFLVRQASAIGDSGATSALTPAEVIFRILPPVWQRWWFISGAAVLLLTALASFERYRTAKMKQLRSMMAALAHANNALEIEFHASRTLAQSNSEQDLPALLDAVCASTGWRQGSLWEADQETGVLRLIAECPEGGSWMLLPGEALAGRVLASGRAEKAEGGVALPIQMGEAMLGVLEFANPDLRKRSEENAVTLATIGGLIGQWLERLRAQRALQASEANFRTLAETASDAIITINEHGAIVFANPSAADVFGYSSEQMIGQNLTMLMPERLRNAHKAGFSRYLATNERKISWKAIELPGLHASGHEISLELSFGEFVRNEVRLFTAVIRDVTERKRTEEALRRSREERLAEIERVRRGIAVDLHDDIGASLTQISVLSEVARRQADNPARLERPLEVIAASSRELVASMSDIVWAISPQRDQVGDLMHRMRRFASDTLTARDIEFSMDLPDDAGDAHLEGNLRRELFLVFKESLNNAVRHSGCTRIDIALRLEKEQMSLCVRDNGRGFDTSQVQGQGHGLASMRGRAAALGARLTIESQTGSGAAVILEAPLGAVRSPSGLNGSAVT